MISQLNKIEKTEGKNINFISEKIKFTVVYKDKIDLFRYADLFSDEIYKISVGKLDRIGTLFINNKDFTMIPVNALINCEKQFISKSKLVKKIRNYIIDLNEKLIDERGFNNQKNAIK